jgi:light-regulated signal transduction histidine kinase (bacteriophytochrome)
MSEQMAKRDWPFGWPQSGFARGIKAFEYLWSRKFGQNVCNLMIERKLALLNNYAATKRQKEGDDPKFQPTLKVTTRDLGNVVEIRVRDNGIGILPEIKDKLFQPFFTTKPTGEGTGLGLSISYDVVTQQHGGTITVDSRVGEFTEFTVRLPRRYRAAIEEAAS